MSTISRRPFLVPSHNSFPHKQDEVSTSTFAGIPRSIILKHLNFADRTLSFSTSFAIFRKMKIWKSLETTMKHFSLTNSDFEIAVLT